MKTIHLWAALAALGCGGSAELTGPDPEAFAVLFVGNSLTYTHDLPSTVHAMLEASGVGDVHVTSLAFPNFGLQDHWARGDVRAQLELGGWDWVVMQQGPSATEGRPSLLEYSERYAPLIRAAGATPALYMVWPASSRDFDFEGVSESYRMAAERVDGVLLPAGDAWRAAWRLDPDLPLYGPDGFHPSPAGSYLAALVIFEGLTGRGAGELPVAAGKPGLSSEVVELLRQAAEEVRIEPAGARTP